MAVATPTDRPKLVSNCCVVEVFGGVFALSCCFLDFSLGGDFCQRTKSDLFLFHILSTSRALKYFLARRNEIHCSFYPPYSL